MFPFYHLSERKKQGGEKEIFRSNGLKYLFIHIRSKYESVNST